MTSVPYEQPPSRESAGRRLSRFFYDHPWLSLVLLLALPLGWLVVVYLGSLVVLLLAAVWNVDPFTSEVVHTYTLDNFRRLFDEDVYRIVAWRTILSGAGVLNWALGPLGVSFNGYSSAGLWLVFTYLWLPFMILPVYAGLERIPESLLEASADLGGKSLRTFFRVTLPIAFPAVVAGSIFTFSLTLGDYIAPKLITSQQFIGTVIYDNHGTNLPVAAAFTLVPVVVMVIYLLVARRLHAFEAL